MTEMHQAVRVLLVAPLPPPRGGIGTWVEAVLRGVSKCESIDVDVIDTAPRWREIYDLRQWRRIAYGSIQGIRDTGRFLWRAWRARPGLVHLTTSGALALGRDLCVLGLSRILGLRSVYHLHFGRLATIESRGGVERVGFWLTLRLCDVVLTLDSASAESAVRIVPGARVMRIPNFIDATKWGPSTAVAQGGHEEGPRQILYLGHVIPTKGISELVRACGATAKKYDLSLLLAGPCDANYRRELEGMVEMPHEWLRFIGEVQHTAVPALMESSDIVALPSHTEGFPNVILEAMACSKPILATSVGAIPEMLDADSPAPCGVVIGPKDTLALAAALENVMTDRSLRQKLGQRAREKVEREYSEPVIMARLISLWRSLSNNGCKCGEQECAMPAKPEESRSADD